MASRNRSRRPLSSPRRKRRSHLPFLETLESRLILSVDVPPLGDPGAMLAGLPVSSRWMLGIPDESIGPAGYIPQQIQTAYGLSNGVAYNNNITFGAKKGDGAGQTIGIFEEGSNPRLRGHFQPQLQHQLPGGLR